MQKRPRIAGAFVLPLFTSAGVALVVETLLLEELDHRLTDVSDGVGDGDARRIEGCNLVRCRALATGDDRACMTHTLARRRLTAGDERRDRLILHVLLDPLRGIFLCRAADLTDDEDGVGVGIVLEELVKIFTEQAGKLMFFVKHANRSRLNSMIQPLTLADMYLKINDDGLSYIEDIHEVQSLQGINEDLFRLSYATYILALADASIQDRQPDPALFAFLKLLAQEQAVAFIPGAAFGPYGEGYVRLSYAASMEVIQEAMSRLKEFMKEHAGEH